MRAPAATLRSAAAQDAVAIAAIYSQGIEDRVATFETEPRRPQDVAPWIASITRYPLLVAEDGSGVIGWARVSAYDARDAYAAWAPSPPARGSTL